MSFKLLKFEKQKPIAGKLRYEGTVVLAPGTITDFNSLYTVETEDEGQRYRFKNCKPIDYGKAGTMFVLTDGEKLK